jgi:hypothetical protein
VHLQYLCGFQTSMGQEYLLAQFYFHFVFNLGISSHMRFQIFLQIYQCIQCKVVRARQ